MRYKMKRPPYPLTRRELKEAITLREQNLRAYPSAGEYSDYSLSRKICSRCGGLFNREWPLKDADGGKEFFHNGVLLYSLRCTSCGEVVDPVILKNRALQTQMASIGKREKRRWGTKKLTKK